MLPTLSSALIQALLQSDEPFSVDFEHAWQWSGYPTRRGAKSKLIDNFLEGTHYISFKQFSSENEAGKVRTVFWMSTECLKCFAVLAGTQKGREVNIQLIESETLLKRTFYQEWSETLTKTSLAICLLQTPWMKRRRDRYLHILSTEHEQQIALFRRFTAVSTKDLQLALVLKAKLKRLVS